MNCFRNSNRIWETKYVSEFVGTYFLLPGIVNGQAFEEASGFLKIFPCALCLRSINNSPNYLTAMSSRQPTFMYHMYYYLNKIKPYHLTQKQGTKAILNSLPYSFLHLFFPLPEDVHFATRTSSPVQRPVVPADFALQT